MKVTRALGLLLLCTALAACGGGGGSAGKTDSNSDGGGSSDSGGSSGGSSGDSVVTAPTLALSLVNSSDLPVSGNAVSIGSTVFMRAVVKDAAGNGVPNKLVSFKAAGNLVTFTPATAQVLTDSIGVAKVQVGPTSVTTAGADTVSATASVNGSAVSNSIDVQTSVANVSLSGLAAAQSSITAFGNTSASVNVLVNGVLATSTQVPVTFTASCGTFSPALANSDSSGKATSTFQANSATCSGGAVTLTATATGATAVQTTVQVQAAQATNLLFDSATPSTIYTSGATGVQQSTVLFRVVDASSNPVIAGTQVRVSLASAAINAGVVFADTLDTTPKVLSTDGNGQVSVIVKSGAFPTPVSLNAQLVATPAVVAASAGLTVNSGRPTQKFFSLSASSANIEGLQYDNVLTSLNVLAADRLGQPVAPNTPVSFITEGGQVSASCSLTVNANGKTACSVNLASQNFRPTNGRVTVLAYMDGDEDFVDDNGNNRFDTDESFTDMGQPFLDADEDSSYTVGEQKVGNAATPGSGIGTNACSAGVIANVSSTCDLTWGPTRVRAQQIIVFSGSFADESAAFVTPPTPTLVTVRLQDSNANPMPQGTTVSATISGGISCTITDTVPTVVPSTTAPTDHVFVLSTGCSGAVISVKATTPLGNVTLLGQRTIP